MVEKQYKYPHQVSFFLVQFRISSEFDWGQLTEEFRSLTVKFVGAELQTYTDIFLTLFNLEKVPNFPQYSPKCDNSSSSMWFSFSVVFWALNNAAAAEPFFILIYDYPNDDMWRSSQILSGAADKQTLICSSKFLFYVLTRSSSRPELL